jgi:hypothetical protein
MKDDYPLKGPTVKLSVELETEVAETIKKMSDFKKIGVSEMINTAVKRFIATHSDFIPKKK